MRNPKIKGRGKGILSLILPVPIPDEERKYGGPSFSRTLKGPRNYFRYNEGSLNLIFFKNGLANEEKLFFDGFMHYR